MNRGSTLNGARVGDTRDVQSRSFLAAGINTILNYLLEHNFHSTTPMSAKVLKCPSVKDFKSIVYFLFRQLDPNYPEFGDKFDEEIITMFKHLGYPTPISKSNITSAGTPHAWPHLVAALTWLIELLSYDEAVASEVTRTEESDEASDKFFHNYLCESYQLFLAGEDDDHADLEGQFRAGFEDRNKMVEDQIKMLEDRNATLSADIAVVSNRRAELPKLVEKKEGYESDLLKFDDLVTNLEKYKNQLRQKTEDREEEMSRLTNSLSNITQENAGLQMKVNNQEMKPEDVAILVAERERLESAQQRASEKRQQIQRKAWESETKLRDGVVEVEDAVRAYNSIAEDLKLVPATARNAKGRLFALEVNSQARAFTDYLVTDIDGVLLKNIADLKGELERASSEMRSELDGEVEALEELETKRSDMETKRSSAEAKIKRIDETYRLEKEQLENIISMHSKEMREMEQRLISSRDTGSEEAKAAASTRRISEIKASQEALRLEHANTKASIINAIEAVVSDCAAHREFVATRLQEIKADHESELQCQLDFQAKFEADISLMPPPVPF